MLQLKKLPLASPLFLSPMAGYTNLPFRAAVRSFGGLSVATTDLVNARSLLELNPKAVRLISAASNDRPLGVQLFGADKDELRDAARFLEDLGVDLIDINMGCPSDKVTRCGAGAALLQDEELTEELVAAVVNAVEIPVTVKMRLGWDEDSINAHVIAPRLEQIGVAAVAVHGRTKMQAYSGSVNLPAIAAVARSVRSMPVFGNGDVHSPQDAARMIREVGCAGVLVGRAALADPFFFRRTLAYLEGGVAMPPTTRRQMTLFMHYHFAHALRYLGEEAACVLFRKVIMGYSEHFSRREVWRTRMQNVETVDEYRHIVRELLEPELGRDCLEPEFDIASLQSVILEDLAIAPAV